MPRHSLAAVVAGLLTAGPAAAQTWNAGVPTGNWSTPANWVGNTAPNSAASASLVFNGTGTAVYTATNDLADPFLLTQLVFNHTGTGGSFTVAGSQLRFTTASGTGNAFLLQQGTQAAVVSAAVDAVRPLQIDRVGGGVGGSLTLSGPLTGAGGILNNYSGQLNLTGGATAFGSLQLFRGDTAVSGGGTFGLAGVFIVGNTSGVTATADVSGAGTTVTAAGGTGVANVAGSLGILTIRAGAGVSAAPAGGQFLIAAGAGTDGRVVVTGTGSTLTAAGVTAIGTSGTGRLTVEAGGTATFDRSVFVGSAAGGVGTLVVDAGTVTAATVAGTALAVGSNGTGSLEVRNGGQLAVGLAANVGANANVLGFATVSGVAGTGLITGAGSTVASPNLLVNGAGAVTVAAGGSLAILNQANIGQTGPGIGAVVVDGVGSSFALTGNGSVGQLANAQVGSFSGSSGTLTVQNGATATIGTVVGPSAGLVVARDPGSTGAVTVTGAGSVLSAPIVQIGGNLVGGAATNGGTATVTVTAGGSLTVLDSLSVFAGGTLSATAGGTVRVGSAGGTAGNINVTAGGKFGGTGTAQGTVLVAPGGLITPGNSPSANTVGTFTVDGSVVFQPPSGSTRSIFGWEIAAAGTSTTSLGGSSGTKDLLVVRNGSLTVDGAAVVMNQLAGFGGTFDPTLPYSWTLMRVDGLANPLTASALSVNLGPGPLADAVAAGGSLSLATFADAGSRYLVVNYTPVPEPAGVLACAVVVAVVAWRRVGRPAAG